MQDKIDSDHDDEEDFISRTQVKREASELQDLGEELVNLSSSHLDLIPLDPVLAHAITLARKLKSNEAKRRQIQFIGKLMRKLELDEIRQGLVNIRQQSQQHGLRQQKTEKWCLRFTEQGPSEIEEFLQQCPSGDRQQLRTLVRLVQKEAKTGKVDTQAKKLFRLVRELIEQT